MLYSIYASYAMPSKAHGYTEKNQVTRRICIYHERESCITILHHAIEHIVTNTINATCARCMMGRLVVIYCRIYKSFPVF